MKLTEENAVDYLEAAGVVPTDAEATVRPLGGGVSNTVLRVTFGDDAVVLKQPLANLAVDDDWPADTTRVHNEAAAARAYGDVLESAVIENVRVPEIRFESETDHVIATSAAPEEAVPWKSELLDGYVDPTVAELVGRCLGAVHARSAGDSAHRTQFASSKPFEQLRLDPYHRTTARRHPDVSDAILAEVERIAGVRETLVHGDYSPKNVLVDREGTPSKCDPPTVWIIDFEVAHWGDPAFDVAFMLNHLYIKSVYCNPSGNDPGRADDPYLHAADSFWRAYRECVDWPLEPSIVRELAILMLARVDGKSPVEYVTSPETKGVLRTVAKRALMTDASTIDDFEALLVEERAGR